MTDINIDYFFSSIHRFPWDLMGLGFPRVGSTHSYICNILAHYEPTQQHYLSGRPTWGELQRFAEKNDGLAKDIVSYCDYCYGLSKTERGSVAAEVLGYIKRFEGFREDFRKRLTTLWMDGRIKIPMEALVKKKINEDEDGHY